MVLWIFVVHDTRLFCYVIYLTLLWANEPIQGLACHIEATVFSEPGCYIPDACYAIHRNPRFGNTCPKHFNRMIHHSKVFITIFHQVFPSKFDQGLCLALAST